MSSIGTAPGSQLESDPQFQREAFAMNLVRGLFPGLQRHNPKGFTADVQAIYDWELSPGWTNNDPLNVNKKGDYASPHAALTATESWLHAPGQAAVFRALRSGDANAAKKAEEKYTVVTSGTLPYALDPKSGTFSEPKPPSVLDSIGTTITDLPSATGKDIGSFLSNHIVLIILVVALVLVLKK